MAGRGRRPDPAMRKRAFRLLEQGRTQGEVRRTTGLFDLTSQHLASARCCPPLPLIGPYHLGSYASRMVNVNEPTRKGYGGVR